MRRVDVLLIALILALFLLWSPAAAKIIVEPGPAELPTDGVNVDDEWFVPVWQAYSPMEFLTIVLLIHCPLLAVPFEIICSAGVLAFLGYRTSRPPLGNKNRSRIYACIRDRPGIAPVEIARATGINRGTIRYHLSRLREAGLVSALHWGGMVGYFRSGDYDTTERVVHLHLQNDLRRQIFALLLEEPGVTQSEVADTIGITRSAVAWHMQHLVEDGLVRADRDGRTVRYSLTDGTFGAGVSIG